MCILAIHKNIYIFTSPFSMSDTKNRMEETLWLLFCCHNIVNLLPAFYLILFPVPQNYHLNNNFFFSLKLLKKSLECCTKFVVSLFYLSNEMKRIIENVHNIHCMWNVARNTNSLCYFVHEKCHAKEEKIPFNFSNFFVLLSIMGGV